jgi:hypothetical protein
VYYDRLSLSSSELSFSVFERAELICLAVQLAQEPEEVVEGRRPELEGEEGEGVVVVEAFSAAAIIDNGCCVHGRRAFKRGGPIFAAKKRLCCDGFDSSKLPAFGSAICHKASWQPNI